MYCIEYTSFKFQANEENLRLLRESLAVYNTRYAGNMAFGLTKAFELLEQLRNSTHGGKVHLSLIQYRIGILT